MVPEGWDVVLFGEVAEFKNGLNFNKDDEGRAIKVVGIPDFWQRTTLTDFSDLKTITSRGDIGDSHMLKSGDLLFVRSNGNPELVGRCMFFPAVDEPISFSGFTIRGRVDRRRMLPEFAASLLGSDIAKDQIRKGGGGTNISNLSQDILGGIPVVVPPLPEQQKIAEVLGVWDRAIATTTALLANARAQKRALMQTLLTPHRRFPGFEAEPWREVRLGDVCDIRKGVQRSKITLDASGTYPVINGGISPSGYCEKWNAEEGTITISEGGNSCGYINRIQSRFWSGGHCYTLENLKIERDFLFHWLKFREVEIMSLRVGSGLPNIQKKAVSGFPVVVPNRAEQTAIAATVSCSALEECVFHRRWAPIPRDRGHSFHAIVGTRSTRSRAAIPREGGQLV